jgi:hypothetical protein
MYLFFNGDGIGIKKGFLKRNSDASVLDPDSFENFEH